MESRPAASDTKDSPNQEYAFVGTVIRLKRAQYDRWKKSYSAIPDFDAELQKADDYYAVSLKPDQDWFFRVSAWLHRVHNRAVREAMDDKRGELWW